MLHIHMYVYFRRNYTTCNSNVILELRLEFPLSLIQFLRLRVNRLSDISYAVIRAIHF